MKSPGQTSDKQLRTPLQFVKGVGPRLAEKLARLGLNTVRDAVFFFPRSYRDMTELISIEHLREERPLSVVGIVEESDLRGSGPCKSVLGVLIREGTHYLRAIWFNQPYLRDRFPPGTRVLLSGTPQKSGVRWEMKHPRATILDKNEEPPAGQILAEYSLTDGIRQPQMRRIIRSIVEKYGSCLEEVMPQRVRDEHQLASIHDAIFDIHLPIDQDHLDRARRRFVFQELMVMQLALALRKSQTLGSRRAPSLPLSGKIDARIRRLFPFRLTDEQNRAIAEISADMSGHVPMNRLLQGDVGSGKTVVAEYAMLLAAAHGYQAVLMVPTEVLARQHARTITERLRGSRTRIGVLTGSLPASERRAALDRVARGELDLLIGTHALLHDELTFANLGVLVIDEQHKFGVRERARLKSGDLNPHYLVMTATPIPRTISMTLFGDLDVSTLRAPPEGRQPVHTYLVASDQRERWWSFFRKKLREGRQGYVIVPLVDDSTSAALTSVDQAFEGLANGELSAFRLGFLHGRLSSDEKDAVMQSFGTGETQVLISTSVVEVGVDVPNATLMTIENGERFGLAQLHQLRGRVSRGRFAGYVCVFTCQPTEQALERLDAFTNSTDGFYLAERDFELRGPGDLFGFQQHGLPPLRIADLTTDEAFVEEARVAARTIIERDPQLQAPDLKKIRRMVVTRYGASLSLSDVG